MHIVFCKFYIVTDHLDHPWFYTINRTRKLYSVRYDNREWHHMELQVGVKQHFLEKETSIAIEFQVFYPADLNNHITLPVHIIIIFSVTGSPLGDIGE